MIISVARPRPGNRLRWRLGAGAALLFKDGARTGFDVQYLGRIVSRLCGLVMSYYMVFLDVFLEVFWGLFRCIQKR